MALYTRHLPAWKRKEVEMIKEGIRSHKAMALVDMQGIPATQLQQIRADLREVAKIRMTRNTLIEHALAELGGDVEGIRSFISGQSALLFTDVNPFKLYKMLEKTKTKMAAKPGEVAPEDIVVEKGPTSFKPGPIVGELQQAGIPAAIEGGKVRIRDTKTVVRKGEVINKKIADVLQKLGVKPMDVGLIMQVTYYEHTLFRPETLVIDEAAYFNQFVQAAQQGFNLSVNAVIPTPSTIGTLMAKAAQEARSLGVEASIYEPGVMDSVIGRAFREMQALKSIVEGQ